MPFIGSSTQVTTDNINLLSSSSRLSVKTQDGQESIYAREKGSLSDGLYSIWATCCPNQARQEKQDVIAAIQKEFIAPLGPEAISIFDQKFSNNQNNGSQSSALKGAALKVVDLQSMITTSELPQIKEVLKGFREQVIPQLQQEYPNAHLSSADATTADFNLKVQDFLKKNPAITKKQVEDFCGRWKENLVKVIQADQAYVNTFGESKGTRQEKTGSARSPIITESAVKLDQKIAAITKSSVQISVGHEVNNIKDLMTWNEQLIAHGELDPSEKKQLEKEQKNLLASAKNKEEKMDDLFSTLNEASRFLNENKNKELPSLQGNRIAQKKELVPADEKNPFKGIKINPGAKELVKNTNLTYKFQNLSQKIAAVKDPQLENPRATSEEKKEKIHNKFFNLLAELSDEKELISNTNNEVLSPGEREYFLNTLLANFTIMKDEILMTENGITKKVKQGAFKLFYDFGSFLATTKEVETLSTTDQTKLENFATSASQILAADLAEEKAVRNVSAEIKKEVEAYQVYEKAERAVGRTPKPMVHRSESKAINQALLSPDARALLKAIEQYATVHNSQEAPSTTNPLSLA